MGRFQVLGKDAYVGHRLWMRFLRFVFAVRGSRCQLIINNPKSIKKSVGARTLAYPELLGLRIAFQPRISNARSPHWIIYTSNVGVSHNNTDSGYTNPMSANHCLTVRLNY